MRIGASARAGRAWDADGARHLLRRTAAMHDDVEHLEALAERPAPGGRRTDVALAVDQR